MNKEFNDINIKPKGFDSEGHVNIEQVEVGGVPIRLYTEEKQLFIDLTLEDTSGEQIEISNEINLNAIKEYFLGVTESNWNKPMYLKDASGTYELQNVTFMVTTSNVDNKPYYQGQLEYQIEDPSYYVSVILENTEGEITIQGII